MREEPLNPERHLSPAFDTQETLHAPCLPSRPVSGLRIACGALLLLLGGLWTLFWGIVVVTSIAVIDRGGGREAVGDAVGGAMMTIPGFFVLVVAIFLFWSARRPSAPPESTSNPPPLQDAFGRKRLERSIGKYIAGGLIGGAAALMTWLFVPPILILAMLYRMLGLSYDYEDLFGFNLALVSALMLATGALLGMVLAKRMGNQQQLSSEHLNSNAGSDSLAAPKPGGFKQTRYRFGLYAVCGTVACIVLSLFWAHVPKPPPILDPVVGTRPGEERAFAGITFCWCPAGSFTMGSPDSETGRKKTEGPQHTVTFGQGFWMSKYEVTHSQWKLVVGFHPEASRGSENLPMQTIDWYECQSFLKKLSRKGAGLFRLPSEAEWEYACRAGTQTPFSFGETLSRDQAHLERDTLVPVGSFSPNAWNLCDMHGSVREWCQDSWHDDYVGAPFDGSAWEANGGEDRVFRSGGWENVDRGVVDRRSASRGHVMPGMHTQELGFRIVRNP